MTTPIIPLPLPNQIADGQPAAAAPVLANMNYIAANVNANAAASAPTTPGTILYVKANSPGAMTSSVPQIQFRPTATIVKVIDSKNEFDPTSGKWTASAPGTYRIEVNAIITTSGVTFNGGATVFFSRNGATIANIPPAQIAPGLLNASSSATASTSGIITGVAATEYITVSALAVFTGGAPTISNISWTVEQLA